MFGELVGETDYNRNTIKITCDTNGNMIEVKDSLGTLTWYEYNELCLIKKEIHVAGYEKLLSITHSEK